MTGLKSRFPVYSQLLRLYPAEYRRRYEHELLQTTADMLDDAPNKLAKLGIWSRLALDLPLNIARQNFEYLGGTMFSHTPSYIKRNSLISGVLLLPFFLAIAANGLDKLINNTTLYNSWLWGRPALILWVFYLPALALMVSLVSYGIFVFRGAQKNQAWLRRALDILHSWPILIVGTIALGILVMVEFHDSAQCFVRSPLHSVAHADQTLRCAEANRAIIPGNDFGL